MINILKKFFQQNYIKKICGVLVLCIFMPQTIWGLIEGTTFFEGDKIKEFFGDLWILIYITPWIIALIFLIYIIITFINYYISSINQSNDINNEIAEFLGLRIICERPNPRLPSIGLQKNYLIWFERCIERLYCRVTYRNENQNIVNEYELNWGQFESIPLNQNNSYSIEIQYQISEDIAEIYNAIIMVSQTIRRDPLINLFLGRTINNIVDYFIDNNANENKIGGYVEININRISSTKYYTYRPSLVSLSKEGQLIEINS